MSSTFPALTTAQRDHISAAWVRIASECARDHILARALIHYECVERAGSVVDDEQEQNFLAEAAENTKRGVTKGNEFKISRCGYAGQWELREILSNDSHASIIISLSWELSVDDKAALECSICAELVSPDVPKSLIEFTYDTCNRPNLTDDHVGCI
ncbi:hypothetical protein PG997_000601 [Apiospora hydei]|uniref:Uncharacterized protein n=1 Tax=Apiospora hydei TaxID=1337664 RepID=A0ABR1XB93_9PEZI